MAINIDGQPLVVKTAYDNAVDIVAKINAYLIAQGIVDSKGDQAFISVNAASPIWLIVFAIGYALSVLQSLVQGAGDSLSIENCSNAQLLNLAAIAGAERFGGSRTLLYMSITASADGPCTVTSLDLIAYTDDVSLAPVGTHVIPAGTTVVVPTQTTVVGPFVILPNTIHNFVGAAPTNFSAMTNLTDSLPGRVAESFSEVRQRLQNGSTFFSSLESCILAIRNLVGITHCNVFFNDSTTTPLVLPGNITVPPRHAKIIINGASDKLAETYLANMLAETDGAETQIYTTLSGQAFAVNYDLAELKPFYIKLVILKDSGKPNFMAEAKKMLLLASGSRRVGLNYTQSYLNSFVEPFPYAELLGLYVSMDGVAWSDTTELNGNEIGVILSDNISYEEKEL